MAEIKEKSDRTEEEKNVQPEVKKVKPVYIRIGRGSDAVGMVIPPFMVEMISKSLKEQTMNGEMATGGGTTGRTEKGNEMARKIFEFVELLEEKAD